MSSSINDAEIKALRDQIARLISEKLEIQRQLEEIKREAVDVGVDRFAAAAIRSVRSAERQIAEQVPDAQRHVVSELETSLRGFMVERSGTLAIRLPIPEHAAPPDLMSTVRMTISQVPVLSVEPESRVLVPAEVLETLERTQASFANFGLRRGATAARGIVDRATKLLATYPNWSISQLGSELQTLFDDAQEVGNALSGQIAAKPLESYRKEVRQARKLMRELGPVDRFTIENLKDVASGIDRIIEAFESIPPPKRRK